MKKNLLFIVCMFVNICLFSQAANKYVKIQTAVKELSQNEYNLIITVLIDKPWHIYSQHIKAGGPVPTSFKFSKNPLVQLVGNTNEIGNLIKKFDNNFKINLLTFADKVEFVQKIKLKAAVKTQINADMEFMICTEEKCLPPTTQKLTFNL